MSDDNEKYPGQFTEAYIPDEAEVRARNSRNRWLGIVLAAFVILVGVITFIRLSSSDLSQSGFYYSVEYESRADLAGSFHSHAGPRFRGGSTLRHLL